MKATVWCAGIGAALIAAVAVAGPLLPAGAPTAQVGLPFEKSGPGHPLGTDLVGRDALVRVLHGGLSVLVSAAGATLVAAVAGVLLGVITGLASRRVGEWTVRAVDVLGVCPPLLLLLVIATGFPASDVAVMVAVGLVCVPFSVRVVRAATRQVAALGYVEIPIARGDGRIRVMLRDVLPNIAGPVVAEFGLRFTAALHLTATAGFLGLGKGAPWPNWGRMVQENFAGLSLAVWPVLAPALLLVVFAVSVNLLADELARRIGAHR